MAARLVAIASAGDPRLAMYASIRDPELARTQRLFVAEGRLVVQRLLDDRQHRVHSVLTSAAAAHALAPSLARLPEDVPVYTAAADVLAAVAGFQVHRGCLALAHRPPAADAAALAQDARLVVALEEVSDPDNVGAVFRNAAAFGVDAVILSPGTCDPLYRKAIRTSMAATLRVPYARVTEWPGVLERLDAAGVTLVALTPAEPSETLAGFCAGPRPARLALLVGAEGPGLSPGALAVAKRRVRIPIDETIDSLNLAAATAVVLSRLAE